MARLLLSWLDVEALVDHLIPQFYGSFDVLLVLARGGIIPGGLIAERLGLDEVLTAAVRFAPEPPADLSASLGDRLPPALSTMASPPTADRKPSLGMPRFLQFPDEDQLRGKRTLIVNHVWNHGRSVSVVAGRVQAAGGRPEICVLHYKPNSSIFPDRRPSYFAAVTSDYIVYPWEASHRFEPYRPMPEPL